MCEKHGAPHRRTPGGQVRVDMTVFMPWLDNFRQQKRKRFDTGTCVDPRPGIIYKLIDPRTMRVRYIGKTGKKASDRLRGHRVNAERFGHSRLHRWLLSLYRDGLEPIMEVVQECLPGMMDVCEREWIARGRAKGWDLVNATDGGEIGVKDEHVKARLAEISREAWKRPEYRERHKAAVDERWAKAKGMTVEQYRERKCIRPRRGTAEGRARQAANTAIHAERVRIAESKKGWVVVPLTHNGTAFVHLTLGKVATIDVDDWDRVSQHRWSCQVKHNPTRDYYRAKTNINQRPTLLNRFVVGAERDFDVLFENGNQLDCRKANLLIIESNRIHLSAA